MVWIDTDMGFDDILAVMMVVASSKPVAGVSLVFGNAPMDAVRANAAGAASLLGWRFPIHTGAERAILGGVETPAHVLGPTGIPTRGRSLPQAEALPRTDALAALTAWLEALDAPGEILALGPLTNIAILSLARPDLLSKIDSVTWMGGGATRGNHTASAEFNAFADPEAVAIVLASGISLRVADLDLCRQVLVGPEDVDVVRAAGTPRGEILADLLGAYVDIALTRGRPAMALYDPTAAAAFVAPDAFVFEEAEVTMELAGAHTRGRTIVDQRPHVKPNALWGMRADAARVRALALDALVEAARS
ncbi:nucleoside hydrolase [Nitratireductor aquimarinus]|uniref:nucleoside hydrolase n=1 Tax=Nitratireductor aquimarinus TaxID=889300 RepID=UPI00293672F0|nr:nucleoside hydrolase [Nitratireductor aquimarinus]MDV2966463.1 nucleoside hydrolase [Nitratireductor aquimarinus]